MVGVHARSRVVVHVVGDSRRVIGRDERQARDVSDAGNEVSDSLNHSRLVVCILEPRVLEHARVECGRSQTNASSGGDTRGEIEGDGEDLRSVVWVIGVYDIEARPSGSLHLIRTDLANDFGFMNQEQATHISSYAIRARQGTPEVHARR